MNKFQWIWRNWYSRRPLYEGLASDPAKHFITKQINDMAQGNYGFAEIVDTLTDGVRAEMKARSTFKGQIDIIRVATFILDQYPKIKEAVEDWPTFEAEVKDLFADEGVQALEAIERNLTAEELEKSRFLRVIRFAAKGYKNTVTVIDLGKEQLALGADIFA